MATVLDHLKVENLTPDELDAALDCAKQVGNLKFQTRGDYEVCDDRKGLETASSTFISKFAPWSKFGHRPSTLQAFRYNKSAQLPVSEPMLLIPTTIATISGQEIQVGSYIKVTKDVWVQAGFYLVFRAE